MPRTDLNAEEVSIDDAEFYNPCENLLVMNDGNQYECSADQWRTINKRKRKPRTEAQEKAAS